MNYEFRRLSNIVLQDEIQKFYPQNKIKAERKFVKNSLTENPTMKTILSEFQFQLQFMNNQKQN